MNYNTDENTPIPHGSHECYMTILRLTRKKKIKIT